MNRRITLPILILSLGLFYRPQASWGFDRYNHVTQYDGVFKKYTKHYFGPGFDWRLFKSQAIAESRLKPDAKSPVGALGIMQIMPATYTEILKKNPDIKDGPRQPRWNIAAGIYYDKTIWNLWKAKRPFQDRIDFMFGSYNAGKGNVLRAQKVAEKQGLNPNLWGSIEISLPRVTGRHSAETLGYVEKINTIKEVLK